MRLHKTGIIILLFTISFNLFSNKFWLTTYEFPYGPKTGISLKNDTTLFAGIYNGVIKSTNSGQHFEIVLNSTAIYTIFISKSGNVFAGGKGKIFKSEDNGIHWDSVSINKKYPVVQITENSKGKLFAVTNGYDVNRQEMSGDNVLFSEDGGQSWTVRNAGLKQYGGCNKIIVDKNDRLYTSVVDDNVTGTGGLYISNNEGLNWVQVNINY
ncbi:MAG: sialidase family protein, partial [Paludibacter sp.]|nr:sialidase family protein [Paludibacter sp.]